MTLNDPRGPRDAYPPRDPRGAGWGLGWVWIVVVIIIIVAGIGWSDGWWGNHKNTAANPPAHTTTTGQATAPASPAPKTPAPASK